MSVAYTAIGWNRQKRLYDGAVVTGVAGFLIAFFAVSFAAFSSPRTPGVTETLIRALGACAATMLHVVLWIGPLARLRPALLPLLYNRRHLGVATFLVALAHAGLVVLWYHSFGIVNPLVSLLTSNTAYGSLTEFPFETLGVVALLILFLMAATSHDFWLKSLTPGVWKALHMGVYVAYALVVGHAALGTLQHERSTLYPAALGVGLVMTCTLHLFSGRREHARDRAAPSCDGPWLDVADVSEIPENRARIVCPGMRDREAFAENRGPDAAGNAAVRERIAVFKYDGNVSAVSNVCAHQNGPLGEGKVVDGCITCPWHGYQYRPADGCAPPPFNERIRTYRVRIVGSRVQVDPNPVGEGIRVEPAHIPPAALAPPTPPPSATAAVDAAPRSHAKPRANA